MLGFLFFLIQGIQRRLRFTLVSESSAELSWRRVKQVVIGKSFSSKAWNYRKTVILAQISGCGPCKSLELVLKCVAFCKCGIFYFKVLVDDSEISSSLFPVPPVLSVCFANPSILLSFSCLAPCYFPYSISFFCFFHRPCTQQLHFHR